MYITALLPLAIPAPLTYRLPTGMTAEVGCRVRVPLGQRNTYVGVIVAVHDEAPQGDFEIKDVVQVLDTQPVVSPLMLRLWQWIAHYYLCPIGDVVRAALPQDNRKKTTATAPPPVPPRGEADSLVNDLASIPLPPKREANGPVNDLASPPLSPRREANGPACDLDSKPLPPSGGREGGLGPHLSPAQTSALDSIHTLFAAKDVVLLHGVTSSGKTEIYTHLIHETIGQGKQVLYLVPEIGLTTQLTERLRRVFGDAMGVYHSRLSPAQRRDLWLRQAAPMPPAPPCPAPVPSAATQPASAQLSIHPSTATHPATPLSVSAQPSAPQLPVPAGSAGGHPLPLILGARSAIFLPWQRLGLIIIDEEHEPSYKQEEPAPRYHARSVALMLARMAGAKTLLGTATPSIETYHLAQTGRYGLVTLTQRFNAVLPRLEVVDTALLRHRKMMKGLLSPRLIEAMRTAMQRGEQTVLFTSRRGYAAMLECRACGWVPRCQHCDVSLTMHRREHCLVCHYCGRVYPIPTQCPACHGTELGQRGMGTEKVEEAVEQLFPEARIARMDLDSTRDKDAYNDIISNLEQHRTDILVGTQMVTKGLDFDAVTVVGVVSADGVLSQPDFRAHERAFHLMSQVAGRAGRRDRQGEVIIQTRQADLPVIDQVLRGDYESMYRDTMLERQLFTYPPYCRIIDVYVRHRSEAMAERAAKDFARALLTTASVNPSTIEVLGPDAPAHARVAGLSIRKVMLKLLPQCDSTALRTLLLNLQRQETRAQIYYDVDPV